MTCPECWKAEATRAEKLIAWLVDRPSPVQAQVVSMSSLIRAACGVIEPTWYERHRQEWENTGDPIELERMLRHVSIP